MVRHQKTVCSTCRRRKSKCDGGSPRCSACVASTSTCHYEKAPSIAYVRSLESRIHDLEAKLKDSESGDVIYHNQTSAIHEDPPDASHESPSSATQFSTSVAVGKTTDDTRHHLVANAAAQKNLELLALNATSPQADISPEICNELLKLHWCWLHPSFLFVYRPAFTRDLFRSARQGHDSTYCPATLFKVLFAHSCRFIRDPDALWSPGNYNETFSQPSNRLMSEAKALLAMETLNQPSIPTIQALLQQSALDVACGRSSSSWLYSGMAFRMAIDLGVHVSPDVLQRHSPTLTTEDVEIRKRLFWSLYLAVPGHIVSCFTQLCKLYTLISQMMLKLYSPSTANDSQSSPSARAAAFVEIERKLQQWYRSLPSFLRISPDKIPELSPPPHITSLNLMYYNTLILLHRPLVSSGQALRSDASRRSWETCRSATTTIYHLLQMYIKMFGFHHITYMNSYCTYTAATTAVHQLETSGARPPHLDHANNEAVWTELKFLLDILQRTSSAMSGLNQSIDIIRTRIKRILDRQAARQLESLFPAKSQPVGHMSRQITRDAPPRPNREKERNAPFDYSKSMSADDSLGLPEGEDAALMDAWLPAFPGQDVSYGADVMLDMTDVVTPETRSALMGSNLDPHMQLNALISDDLHFGYDPFADASFSQLPPDEGM
ncbi:fungal-specific transcription factor domain-containing protein [Aspergillus pseudoustus]|uniref:Fungal-specific transcription factor domain-containing protein n=1 Tax=Aspergillus pseudoustus TaxID=1810923 RepID=A0ABR4K5C2_9EURO